MEKITIEPQSIRALGNIVSTKTLADFTPLDCNLSTYGNLNGARIFKFKPAILADNGTQSDHNDIWGVYGGSLSRGASYTTINHTSESFCSVYLDLTCDKRVMEFDIALDTSTNQNYDVVSLRVGSPRVLGFSTAGLSLTGTTSFKHVKIVVDGLSVTYYVDGTSHTATLSQLPTRFQLHSNSTYAKTLFKNFSFSILE